MITGWQAVFTGLFLALTAKQSGEMMVTSHELYYPLRMGLTIFFGLSTVFGIYAAFYSLWTILWPWLQLIEAGPKPCY